MLLKIIIASTRPGRKGPALGYWINEIAKKHGVFEVKLIDLKEVNLPFLDEAEHPRFQKYEHEHTKAWSREINEADAFIFVTPEYNFGLPATLKNALDFVFNEWAYKPVGFVSYGGVAGGTRAVQMLKQVITALKMMPVYESVNVPAFTKFINAEGQFVPEQGLEKAAFGMLDEMAKWVKALTPLMDKNKITD